MLWTFGIGFLIVLAIVVVIVFLGWQMTRPTHHGVAAEGTIIKKGRSHSSKGGISQPWLRYEYRGPDGQRYEYRIHTTEDFWGTHEVGDSIEIAYVRSKPSVTGGRYMVNQLRETLKLSPL